MSPSLSVIVVAYNMDRELPRTLRSLSTQMQCDVDGIDYEVIVVDNGSTNPVRVEGESHTRVVSMVDATPSPAPAVNRGLTLASGELIGVMVDGARLASPGLISSALLAARLHERPIISTLGFHLGPKVQMESVAEGYDERHEDRLLESSGWEQDGYRLFGISCFAGSSSNGWFAPLAESNALFMPGDLWLELGGYDESFVSPGGGLVNHDTFGRAHDLPDTEPILLLGEGTFHQVHGGVATNASTSPWRLFHEEYVRIRGVAFRPPELRPIFVGKVTDQTLPFIEESARRAIARTNEETL